MSRRTARLPSDPWNACAAPWKCPLTPCGSIRVATSLTRASAGPRNTPGARPKDTVTDGNWPKWLTAWGPTTSVACASVSKGTTRPPPVAPGAVAFIRGLDGTAAGVVDVLGGVGVAAVAAALVLAVVEAPAEGVALK